MLVGLSSHEITPFLFTSGPYVTNLIACVCLQVASEKKNYLCDVAGVMLKTRKVMQVIANQPRNTFWGDLTSYASVCVAELEGTTSVDELTVRSRLYQKLIVCSAGQKIPGI